MSLKSLMSGQGAVVLAFYNAVDAQTLENKGTRDSLDLVINADQLVANLQILLDSGYIPVNINHAIGKSLSNTFSLMACDGYDLSNTSIPKFCTENGIPLAFSIPAAIVGMNKPSWTNQIEIALDQALSVAGGQTISILIPGTDQSLEISDVETAIAARHRLKDAKQPDVRGDQYVTDICTALTQACQNFKSDILIRPTYISDSPFDRKMTWNQLQQHVDAGAAIITHGYAHNGIFGSDTQQSVSDVADALTLLEDRLNLQNRPTILTYPEGKTTAELSDALVERTDISHAFTMEEGVITLETPKMMLPRYTIKQEHLAPSEGMS